jgi:haloalkane dehalogenase
MTYGPDLGQQPIPGVHRTPDARFATVDDFPFAPHYLDIDGLRMHCIDEGSGAAGTFILLHDEPVWSYMYRDAIQPLAAAGYRVIAPDNIGFGKSDKVIDVDWYTLDHHVLTLKTLVTRLDLRGITIVVNDWGGPNGLIIATEMPDRFDRLIILNTWLHHEGFGYTDALRQWNVQSQSLDFTTGVFTGTPPPPARNYPNAVLAPFDSLDATAGPLRWPWMLPFAQPEAGNARRQAAAYDALASWKKPAHVIFGDSDPVFTEQWGRRFAAHIPGATFTIIEGEGHRPLLWTGGRTDGRHRGGEFAELVLRLIDQE